MTDNYIGAPLTKYQQADNCIIRPDAKLQSRWGCAPSTLLNNKLTSGERLDSIYKFKGTYLYQNRGKILKGVSSEVVGPGSASAFSTSVQEFNQNSYAEWNNHLFVTNDLRTRPLFIKNPSGAPSLYQLGLPKLTSSEVSAITFSASGSDSRIYAFVRKWTYSIDTVEFAVRSAVSDVKTCTGAPTNTITNLPVLTNGANQHYDTTNIKLEIYRTVDVGNVFYLVGEVDNGTTTYVDSTDDADLFTNELLYLEADDLDYDLPPKSKFLVQLNGVLYCLNVEDSFGDVYPNRIVQCNPDQPHAAPEANCVDVDGDLTGGGVAGQNVVVFTQDRTYRLQGFFDSTGDGGITKIELSRTVGCVSHKSIVQTQQGCYFAAKDGFYFTDGFQVLRISEDIPTTYASLVSDSNQAKRIYGTYNPFDKHVMWAASSSSSVSDNDVMFVAHLYWGQRPDTPFTRWSGGHWPDNFKPTALWFDPDLSKWFRGHTNGWIFEHASTYNNDVAVDALLTSSTWNTLAIIYDYIGFATDCGTLTNRKWGTKLIVNVDAIGKVTMMPFSNNDNSGNFQEMTEIRSNSRVLWRDTDLVWKGPVRWNYTPIVTAVRRFPQRSIRFSYKQIRLTNSNAVLFGSDVTAMGKATIDGVTKTVTLTTAGVTWTDDVVGHFIVTETDSYTKQYRITTRNSSTQVTVEDITNSLPTGSLKFKVKGYRKREVIRLLGYSLIYDPISPSQTPYRSVEA